MAKKARTNYGDDETPEDRQRRSTAYRAFDNSDESKHIAELLELAGATKISPAAKLQVAAMRTRDKDRLAGVIAVVQRQAEAEDSESGYEANEKTALAAVLAAAKLKKSVQVETQALQRPEALSRMAQHPARCTVLLNDGRCRPTARAKLPLLPWSQSSCLGS